MSSLISRGAVLTASRLSNFGLQLLSPLLLVRILSPEAYGQYQEFMIYAMLLSVLCAFSINSSLTYFLPLRPQLEKSLVSQTILAAFALSSICILALLFCRPVLLRITSYDFVSPLAAYVFLFVNMDWLEPYWLVKRRMDLVFIYGALRLAVRITVLLAVAYYTRDVSAILWSLVMVEGARVIMCTAYVARSSLFVTDIKLKSINAQMNFAVPLWATAVTQQAGREIGKIAVGVLLGPASLAYYAIGSYLIPIVRVMRGAIADVVYPELVRVRDSPDGALRLWQRTNVLYCATLFPLFVLLLYYADLIVTTAFTAAYRQAVPIFQVYAFFLLRRCFNVDVLLRIRGRTGFMFFGTIAALALNVALIFLLYPIFGLVGPSIAFVLAEIVLELYYVSLAKKALDLTLSQLVEWPNIGRITASCLVAVPVLVGVDKALPLPDLVRAGIACFAYFCGSWYFSYRLGVNDIGRVMAWAAGLASGSSRK